ncbi:MAG: pyrimidine 5'-nucleotidase [Candidatus Dactylopiibacterium sp.]|nr:pyrimidine 5'-nucleotidase [Candidatus Dactylopiibacterium sp.]
MQPVWLFDLDNTLHDAGQHIFPHINRAMTEHLAARLGLSLDEASTLRAHYWKRYGATVHGMVRHHGARPGDFLAATHQFADLGAMVVFDPAVRAHLRTLPGRKVLFSNAPRRYVREILRYTGLDRVLDDVFTIEDLCYRAKPDPCGYQTILRRLRVKGPQCIMVEDTAQNLRPAKRLGMRTVWITPRCDKAPPWVDLQLRSVRALRAF